MIQVPPHALPWATNLAAGIWIVHRMHRLGYVSSIRQALQTKRQDRIRMEEERQWESERQTIEADELRQLKEEEQHSEVTPIQARSSATF